MKTLWLILFISFQVFAESPAITLSYQIDKKTSKKILIKTLHGMKVSDECLIKSKICDSYTDGLPANSKKQTSHWRGNPASQFCENKGGSSVILKDEKSNEYDYCKFEEDFFIDSWDLYERSKK